MTIMAATLITMMVSEFFAGRHILGCCHNDDADDDDDGDTDDNNTDDDDDYSDGNDTIDDDKDTDDDSESLVTLQGQLAAATSLQPPRES